MKVSIVMEMEEDGLIDPLYFPLAGAFVADANVLIDGVRCRVLSLDRSFGDTPATAIFKVVSEKLATVAA